MKNRAKIWSQTIAYNNTAGYKLGVTIEDRAGDAIYFVVNKNGDSAQYEVQIEYFENLGGAAIGLLWESTTQAKEFVPQSQLYSPVENPGLGLKGEYYDNKYFTDLELTRIDVDLNFG
ncbi:hypothetical protein GC101_10485 [Paenibacillus sp. LMG 31459]|uniref:Uncharacterized protein n=1 Tax=Paenibacillus phytohabitans TaxID=2654978 RepID=A0ABX1YEQ7_9BACL|nr:hypothetical protein [Paenibacillus phytohabitans]